MSVSESKDPVCSLFHFSECISRPGVPFCLRLFASVHLQTSMGTSEKSLSHESKDAAVQAFTETSSEPTWSPEAERKLVRRIDRLLVPILWLMSLLNYMDRAKCVSLTVFFHPRLTQPPV